MADDARISTALPRHPKMVKLIRKTQEPGAWALVCLFLWVAENRPDGDLSGLSGDDIEIAAGWGGTPGNFVRTLAEVRFLDGQEDAYKIHDWAEHNPWAATRPQRIESAKKAAAARWERKKVAGEPHAERMRPASDSHETAMPSAMLSSPLLSSPLLSSPPHSTIKPCGADAPAQWIPADAWAGFVDMRKKTRKPLTDRAITLIVEELDRLRTAGQDPGAILDQSTRNNWKDVYPLKGSQGNGKYAGNGNRAEQRQADNLAAAATAKRDLGLAG